MSLRSFIFDHVWLKFFSLVLATLIWLAVSDGLPRHSANEPRVGLDGRANGEGTRTFAGRPIQLFAAPDHGRVQLSPDRATVVIRGPEDLLQGIKAEDIDAFVRLPDKQPPSGRLLVQVRLPAGASVVGIVPINTQVIPGAP